MSEPSDDRRAGALLGLACGDAVGTTVEFRRRGTFPPVTDMVGGGPFKLPVGCWTDDTSMALCLAESLHYCNGFDARDQMTRYVNWWQHGYFSSTGTCFDIGNTVQRALANFVQNGDPFAGSSAPHTAGNGSLMRLAPVVLHFHPDRAAIDRHCRESSRTTHAAPEAIECCALFGAMIADALDGRAKREILAPRALDLREPKVAALAAGDYRDKSIDEIRGTGYAVHSLEAALWCFHHHDDFESTILAATNLGDDADTTAAIAGQLAGAHYGKAGIPRHWLQRLHQRQLIETMATRAPRAA